MIIKVCGIKDAGNLLALARLPVDILGLVFHPGSPRYVDAVDQAMAGAARKVTLPKTGVFVDAGEDRIRRLAGRFRLDYIQLHGNESPGMCAALGKEFRIIKAFRISSAPDLLEVEAYEGLAELFLFDTRSELPGGSGKKFDWTILDGYNCQTPYLLGGGIGPGDEEKIRTLRLPGWAGIDLNSRFELSPGIKDIDMVKNFINAIR